MGISWHLCCTLRDLLTSSARLQVAKVDTIELSQDELYSSRIKDFELRGRQTHPRIEGTDYTRGLNSTQWKLLGHFRAAKMKGTQVCACMCASAMPRYTLGPMAARKPAVACACFTRSVLSLSASAAV